MRASTLRRGLATVAASGVSGLAYAGLVERRWYALRHVTVPVLRPAASRPVRVLHLSDLHLLRGQEHVHGFVRECLRSGPELVVATGDLLGGADAIDDAVGLLADVADGRAAVAVLGSNDFFGPRPKNPARYLVASDRRVHGPALDTPRLVDGLAEGGWHVLDNRRALLDSPAGTIDVAGLGDPHIDLDHPEMVDWSAPPEPPALRLGVVHAPYRRAVEALAGHGYDLLLAGHTHGGQLRVPGIGALVANCDLPLRQARGLSRTDGSWLHVSAGLGTSRYAPFRFACRPEATLLDLVARPPQAGA